LARADDRKDGWDWYQPRLTTEELCHKAGCPNKSGSEKTTRYAAKPAGVRDENYRKNCKTLRL